MRPSPHPVAVPRVRRGGRPLLLAILAAVGGCTTGAPAPAPPPALAAAGPVARPITPVADPRARPYRSVCYMNIHRPLSSPHSTAALISRTQMVTAAHNVYSPFYNRVRAGDVRCGKSGGVVAWAPAERFGWKDQKTAAWYFWKWYHRDYARVRLPVSAPYPADFRLLRPDEAAPGLGEIVHVAGFPWTDDVSQGTMYETEGQVLEVTRDIFYYDAHTRGGMSGAPVWVERGNEFIIVGIHVAGTDSTPAYPARATARRINAEAFSAIQQWMGADAAP